MHELLYRFEFPERPGALMNFLNHMSAGWNISLFHYRNHGADYGRVLVGMQVPQRKWANLGISSRTWVTPIGMKARTRRIGFSSDSARLLIAGGYMVVTNYSCAE